MARILPAVVVCAYLAIVFAVGAPSGWRDLGVPGETPSFLDLRSVTSAWECDRQGVAVLPVNPCDPQRRPANYPRLWLLPSHLGWGQGATVPIGIAIAVLFLGTAVLLTPARGSPWHAAGYAVFLCTPGIMLGVERGNVDLLIFCLVVLAVWLSSRRASLVGAALAVLAAAVLKLFPIFAAPLLLRRPLRRAAIVTACVCAAFAAYLLATFDDIRAILRAVPKSGSYSYGVDIFGHRLSQHGGGSRFLWDAALVLVGLAAGYLLRDRARLDLSRFEADAFVAGVSVFLFTYVFFRNFDYRLSFLLLCLPVLLRRAGQRLPLAWVALAAMLGALCLESRAVLPAGVVSQFVLFVALLAFVPAVVAARATE